VLSKGDQKIFIQPLSSFLDRQIFERLTLAMYACNTSLPAADDVFATFADEHLAVQPFIVVYKLGSYPKRTS